MKPLLALFFLLLLFCSCFPPPPAAAQSVFHDENTLQVVQELLVELHPLGFDPRPEVERIFAYPDGPLQAAMSAQPRIYAALLFTVFEPYLTEVTFFNEEEIDDLNERLGANDRLLVLLKDHRLLPVALGGTRPGQYRVAVDIPFGQLHRHWEQYLDGTLLEPAQLQGEVVDIPMPDPDQQVPVPGPIQPFLVEEEEGGGGGHGHLEDFQRFGHLEERFLNVYVEQYPVLTRDRIRESFERTLGNRLRLAVLQALFWMLVVRPFQTVIRQHPRLFPLVNADALTPNLVVVAPAVAAAAPAPRPLVLLHDRFERNFRDIADITFITRRMRNQRNWQPVEEMDRIFEEQNQPLAGPLQGIIDTYPGPFAAVLFTVFRARFEVAFANAQNPGFGNPLCVLLKDHHLLPEPLSRSPAGRGHAHAQMAYTDLYRAWTQYLAGTLVPADLQGLITELTGEPVVPVPAVLRVFFCTVAHPQSEEAQDVQELQRRFLEVYADRNPLENRRRRHNFFYDSQNNVVRRSVLRSLYWMLVVRPFQEVIRRHPDRFPGVNPEVLTPQGEDVPAAGAGGRGPGGGGPGGRGGRGGRGRGARGGGGRGAAGRGGQGGRGGRGGGGGNPPPPPPQNPPAPIPPQPAPTPAPAPAQPGTCSASTSRPSASKRGDPDGPPPSSKKHKPEGPPPPGAGGSGAGMAV